MDGPARRRGLDQYHCGTLPLELFRRETEGYKVNLTQEPPQIFVLLRGEDEAESRHEFLPFLVTASPYEAQDYLDSGEEIVEAVAMPPDLVAFVQAFVDEHHVDEVFHKRKRQKARSGDDAFSRRRRSPGRGQPRVGGLAGHGCRQPGRQGVSSRAGPRASAMPATIPGRGLAGG